MLPDFIQLTGNLVRSENEKGIGVHYSAIIGGPHSNPATVAALEGLKEPADIELAAIVLRSHVCQAVLKIRLAYRDCGLF
jgi:hypothetical protein